MTSVKSITAMKFDLLKTVGNTITEDFSSTGRAKLLSVGSKYAKFEMVKSPWSWCGIEDEGKIYKRPIVSAWNTLFC